MFNSLMFKNLQRYNFLANHNVCKLYKGRAGDV